MAWIRWDLIFSIGLFVSPAFMSTDQSGFRRFYVLQPGPSGTDRVHVSSISSRSGATGQAHSYNVELTSSYGGQVRTRRMGNPLRQDTQFAQHQQVIRHSSHNVHPSHQMKLSGVNVCGGQCCHGWSKAPGSQRCTKPNCMPQCQNGGMCLRPQLCVCKPGSKGKVCEQKTAPTSSAPGLPGNSPPSGPTNRHTNGQNAVPQRPIPQQVPAQGYAPSQGSNVPQMRLTVKQSPYVVRPQHIQQQVRPIPALPGQSQQFIVKPKYYHTHTQTHVQHQPDRAIPLTVGHNPIHVGNHTGRIKVVFTPTICKVTCMGGRCHNNCELGNTTTIISENGHATDTLTAPNFRVVVCHLPCINGGKCSARDKCQCPPNFTGKFCQMPVQNGQRHHQQSASSFTHTSQIHSTHTLPLTYNTGQNPVNFNPSIVNIHVKHPPEASVQIHQVSQLDSNGQKVKGSSSQAGSTYTSYHRSESNQKIQQQGHNVIYPSQHGYVQQYQPVTSKSQLGRCFQETTGTQCGKVLPGLSKQEDCCGTIGTSWGFHKCQKCPEKPSIPLTGSRHTMDCPQGYKRINNSSCQDLNECQLQGVCPNGDCMNTVGSYRCLCKTGYMPDPTLSTCIPDTPAVQEEKGACFRLVSSGRQCLHPVSTQLSKQLCCCSVGKAWGPRCDKCPLQGTAKFKEICPGGMGYTVLPKPPNRIQPDAVRPVQEPVVTFQEPVASPLPLPTPEKPVEALSVTQRQMPSVPVVTVAPEQELDVLGVDHSLLIEPIQPQLSPGVSTITIGPIYPEVVEKTAAPAPVEILPSNAGQDIAPTQFEEVNECQVNPHICGQGICYNTAEGYTCICNHGYQLDDTQTTCVDVDECEESPPLCSNGHCENTPGHFLCVCQSGFMLDEEETSCVDVDECVDPNICPDNSICVNKLGYHICHLCDRGYKMSSSGQCEDIDECADGDSCPSGTCVNLDGSFECQDCPPGFRGQRGVCVDIDECLDPATCADGVCTNLNGYFVCSCDEGFALSADEQSCEDVDECQDVRLCTRGHCQNTKGSFLCSCEPGFVLSPTGDQCVDVDECVDGPCERVGQCVNTLGSYQCSCPQGFHQVNGTTCQDIDECLEDSDLCLPFGECLNVDGSFHCLCQSGFAIGDQHTCEDIDECSDNETLCGSNGFCENTMGSFRCLCDRGFQEAQEGHGCVDVNECELLSGVCGEAQCENVEGAFLCMCSEEGQEYNQMTAKCSPTTTASPVERKECYYNLNDENLCENVLTSHVTMEECCCTLGAGWGDNCEVHPCPVQGTDQFNQMCPAGQGSIPSGDSEYGVDFSSSYKDADECVLFGEEICKDGFCLNSPGSYECYCKTGLYYDEAKLQCRDINECLDESICVEGVCMNSEGSYTCFCTPPMVLDPDNKHCVFPPDVAEHHGHTDYQGLCWQTVMPDTMTCSEPLANKKTTYTECCCLHGEAWGMECALCPLKNTEDYASMCNVPVSGGRRPYGRDALVAVPAYEYREGQNYGPTDDREPAFEEENPYASFEGLRAEECGILNGCENGRCVRVQEGYICDCFDGYTLDMTRMACVDVNECTELNNRMSLCKNARCINTQGSYRCACLPGYKASERPNYCVPEEPKTAAGPEERE